MASSAESLTWICDAEGRRGGQYQRCEQDEAAGADRGGHGIHSGGFLSGDRTQVADYATVLADRGFVVASLEYSLAPGHHYPVPVRQGTAALAYLAAHASTYNGNAKELFVGGDSAGAQIASQVATGNKQLKGVILFCGLYDMRTVGATNFPALRTYLWAYTGVRDYTDYPDIDQLSTTEHITADYPPTYLTVGDKDPFEPQARELEDVLRKHRVDVTTRYWQHENLNHEYQFDLRTQPAETVLADTVAFLNGHSPMKCAPAWTAWILLALVVATAFYAYLVVTNA